MKERKVIGMVDFISKEDRTELESMAVILQANKSPGAQDHLATIKRVLAICPACRGTGVRLALTNTKAVGGCDAYIKVVCEDCDGFGSQRERCPTCGRKG